MLNNNTIFDKQLSKGHIKFEDGKLMRLDLYNGLSLEERKAIKFNLSEVAQFDSLAYLHLWDTNVTGNITSIVGLHCLTSLGLVRTNVKAPEGFPKNRFGELRYSNKGECAALFAWLREHA